MPVPIKLIVTNNARTECFLIKHVTVK